VDLSASLQRGLEKAGKPWYKMRAMRIFRDKSSLAVTPALWREIEKALSVSAWFVLMASLDAAASKWVDQEVRWWLDHRSADRLLIVLTSGTLEWDAGGGDFDARSEAIPPALWGAFRSEPLWVRAQHGTDDAVAGVGAAIRQVPKDQYMADAIREHRRTMRLAGSAITGLAVLLVTAIIGALIAVVQRANALTQENISLSRLVAATSENEQSTNLRLALLLAVESYHIDPNTQTLAALMQADTAVPALVRYLPSGGRVTSLVGDRDGRAIVAGLADGRIVRWRLPDPRPQTLFSLQSAVSSLAVSADGEQVAAADGMKAEVWQAGKPVFRASIARGERADSVALSPSGRTLLVHASRAGSLSGSIAVVSLPIERIRANHADPADFVTEMVMPSDSRVMLQSESGFWQWREITTWRILSSDNKSSNPIGVTEAGPYVSGDGKFFTATNAASTIQVWPTSGVNRVKAPFTALAPVSFPKSAALSYNGTALAVAEGGVIYVTPVARAGAPRAALVQLVGNPSINLNDLSFLGGDAHLISATGSTIAVWNLKRTDRLERAEPAHVKLSCSACPGPEMAISPDGGRAAMVTPRDSSAVVQPLPGVTGRAEVISGNLLDGPIYGPPVWQESGRHVILPYPGPAAGVPSLGSTESFAAPLPIGNQPAIASALSADGKSLIFVGATGGIYQLNAENGALVRTGPHIGPPLISTDPDNQQPAAIDPADGVVALASRKIVTIVRIKDGKAVGFIPAPDVASVAFGGSKLLVQLQNGTLQVWNHQGTGLELTIAGDSGYRWPPVANQDGTLVARQRIDGSVVIDSLLNGATLDTLSTPSRSGALMSGVVFAPNGSDLITVTDGYGLSPGTLISRNLSGTALVTAACKAAGSSLTRPEWRAYIGTPPPALLACR